MPELFQSFGKPRARDNARPVERCRIRETAVRDVRAREHAQRVGRAPPGLSRRFFNGPKLVQHFGELLSIHFDPAAANEMKAIGVCEQLRYLAFAQSLAIERDFHPEVQKRVRADSRRRLVAHGRGHLRPRWTIRSPSAWHANDHTSRFEER